MRARSSCLCARGRDSDRHRLAAELSPRSQFRQTDRSIGKDRVDSAFSVVAFCDHANFANDADRQIIVRNGLGNRPAFALFGLFCEPDSIVETSPPARLIVIIFIVRAPSSPWPIVIAFPGPRTRF